VHRDVTVDDAASTRLPQLLRHATCPACKARDPDAVATHRRDVRRGRRILAASYASLGLAAVLLPKIALLPPLLGLLLWAFAMPLRLRRRLWLPILIEPLIAAAMITWIIAFPHLAYVVPAAVALLVFLPRPSSSDPFADAAEQLRFAETPYRG
jgi:hypothetical protein